MSCPKKRNSLNPKQPDFRERRKAMLKRRMRVQMRKGRAAERLGASMDGGEMIDVVDMIFGED
jgi:hypothetical protein